MSATRLGKLRADTNKRFEHIEMDIAEMKTDIKAIVARFDRDYLLLAPETENIKKPSTSCLKNKPLSLW